MKKSPFISITISDKGDIRVLLDDNLTATSLMAGSKTTDTAAGVDGMVTATGTGGAYLTMNGADGSLRVGDASGNFAAMVQNYGGPKFLNSIAAGSPRFQYWAASAGQDETTASTTLYTLATLNDGLQLSGDSGTGSVLLNNTLTVTGGETSSSDLSSGSNIGVAASGSTLKLKLAKNLTVLTSISLGDNLALGNQTSSSATGDYLTGLDNTTWSGTPVSGRAATEEQLKLMQSSITQSAQGGGFGLADDKGNAVKADLGSTIGIHGDSNITTAVSEDGKSIDIKLNNQVDLGTDGSLKAGGVTISNKGIDAGSKNITNVASGIVTGDDSDNTNAANIGDVKTLAGEAAKTEIGKLGSRDFAGDDGETVSRGLGESMKLSGGADTSKLTNGNIGVVKNAAGDGLDIRLSSELTGLTSVTTGNTTMSSDGIKIASAGEGTHAVEVTNSNVSMGGQQIHDVAPGTSDTDAVNVSQLKGLVSGVDGAVNKLNNRLNRVGAGAAALAALHPLDFNPEDKWNFAAGFGHYVNANAGAIGAFYQPNEDTLFSLGGSWGGGENMVNAGVSIRLGHGNSIIGSRTVMAREIMALKQQVEAQSLKLKENEDLKARLAKQDQEIAELKAMVLKLAAKG